MRMVLLLGHERCMMECDSYGTKDRAFLGLEDMSRLAGCVLAMVNVSPLISNMIPNTIKHGMYVKNLWSSSYYRASLLTSFGCLT